MSNSSIGQRLLMLTLVPLLALVLAGGALLLDSRDKWIGAERTQIVLHPAIAAGSLAHTLQIERGATAGFI